jgi:UDP-N-acetylglucosamine diphosphorylase/glucosamine-1-phosphate N-acetyltransferase
MNVILIDNPDNWQNLKPFTFTRPVSEIRIGAFTIAEKWENYLSVSLSYITTDYLSKKYKCNYSEDNLYVCSNVLPDRAIVEAIKSLSIGQVLKKEGKTIARRTSLKLDFTNQEIDGEEIIEYKEDVSFLSTILDIFKLNGQEIEKDFKLLTKNKTSQKLSETNKILGNNIFIEEGAKVECSILNSTTGPIYIAKNAEIMEGSIIRGPLFLGENAVIKMGTKIYGPTTIGPYCKVGGEVSNSVFFAYSNKGHDGFLGNSVVGEWCNLGADTNTSNLKNNYGNVKIFNYAKNEMVQTDEQFCGLMMADHSKSGINTMFNTATVVGVAANVFGADFPPKHIPSFSWGGASGFVKYDFDKMLETAKNMMSRRNITLSQEEIDILRHIYQGN